MEKTKQPANFSFCQWEITTKCNLKCACCEVPNQKKDEQTLETILLGINDLESVKVKKLEFIGGEPTLLPELPFILKKLNYSEIESFAVLTNAINISALYNIQNELVACGKGWLVVSINYLEKEALELIEINLDSEMAKKSLAGWKALKKFAKMVPVRVNCVIHELNIKSFSEIARLVLETNGFFSFCPAVYKKQGANSDLNFTFRSLKPYFALRESDKKTMEFSVLRLKELKKKYPDKIIPDIDYIDFLIKCCKKVDSSYPLNCKNLGLPYIRVSNLLGRSEFNGMMAPRLKACSDILGPEFSKLVTSDLRIPGVRDKIADIYQNDSDVVKCQRLEGCPWSVTFLLSKNFK